MDNKDNGLEVPQIRESNLEIYRILVMLLIIAHHYVVNSGITDVMYLNGNAKRTVLMYFFGAWGKSGINGFVLITGYFMCKSQISAKKFLKLLFEIQFYKLVCYSIFWVTKYEPFSVEGLLNLLIPVTALDKNFPGCYLVFYLLIPFLNELLQNLSERMHGLLIILSLSAYTIMGSVQWMTVTFNYVTWFCVLYICSAYIRLYPKKIFESASVWGWAMIASLSLSMISILLRLELVAVSKVCYYLSDSNKILAFTNGITSFMFFKNWKCRYIRCVNLLGSSTFGVLLIHANSGIMRRWLWKDLLNNVGYFYSDWLVVHMVASVIGIFAVCTVIDLLRKFYLERPFFRLLDKYLNRDCLCIRKSIHDM